MSKLDRVREARRRLDVAERNVQRAEELLSVPDGLEGECKTDRIRALKRTADDIQKACEESV